MRLFISYAHVDRFQVSQLVEVLREADYDPWFDHKLMPGQDWKAELLKAIQRCDAFLYTLTPESVNSEWCQWEFARAVDMGKPIIPVLMQAKTSLPDSISRLQYADFTDGPTARSVARLLGALRLVTVVLPAQSAPAAPENPRGTPAQAIGTLNPEGIRSDAVGATHVSSAASTLPNPSHILPPPFDWCEIPAGWVTLEDASDDGGTKGGKFHVKRFWMAKYPITNAQYAVFANDEGGYLNPSWWDYSPEAQSWREANPAPKDTGVSGADLPRTNVCWYEAVAFCRWLSNRTFPLAMRERGAGGEGMIMLPTEQQWQRAAQGDDNRVYPWGDEVDFKRLNAERKIGKPTAVTAYPKGASPYGVFDMAGNVYEWCSTKWGEDDNGLEGEDHRVLRGGSWDYFVRFARCASRNGDYPDYGFNFIGFRVVCAVPV